MTDSIPSGYKPLTCDTLPGYLSEPPRVSWRVFYL